MTAYSEFGLPCSSLQNSLRDSGLPENRTPTRRVHQGARGDAGRKTDLWTAPHGSTPIYVHLSLTENSLVLSTLGMSGCSEVFTEARDNPRFGAGILAAGMPSRMGEAKQLLRLGENTLLGQGSENVRCSGVKDIVGREPVAIALAKLGKLLHFTVS